MPKNSQAKARALRIPLESYSSDRLTLSRNILTIVAVTVCVGWLLAGHFSQPAIAKRYCPGPVSKAHAHLGCDSCHARRAPLSNATFLSSWKTGSKTQSLLWHRTTDMMCKKCHPVTGSAQATNLDVAMAADNPIPISPHSNNQKIESVDSCASCHAEHNGVDHLPSQVVNAKCVDCHQEIENFWQKAHEGIATTVTSFEMDHPSFKSVAQDNGTLKFNHALHMSVGIRRTGSPDSLIRTINDYPEHDGVLTGMTNAKGEIALGNLNCSFCHQPKGGSTTQNNSTAAKRTTPTATEPYMSMPNFEQNCQVCHSIDLLPNPELEFTKKLKVKHGASPEQLNDALRVYFSLEAIAPNELTSELQNQSIETPIEAPTRLWDIENTEGIPDSVKNHVNVAITKVRTSCFYCHFGSDSTEKGIPTIRTMAHSTVAAINKPVFESVWFKHARFDHSAHRDLNCVHCHQNSKGKGALLRNNESIALDRPMIKDRDSCLECHQSPSKVKSKYRPGPTNCIACHTYHGGGNRGISDNQSTVDQSNNLNPISKSR